MEIVGKNGKYMKIPTSLNRSASFEDQKYLMYLVFQRLFWYKVAPSTSKKHQLWTETLALVIYLSEELRQQTPAPPCNGVKSLKWTCSFYPPRM